jgi:hypothetical protein
VTAKETLALWDVAVALHRAYWLAVDIGLGVSDALRRSSIDTAAGFIAATGLAGPDHVALGGSR